MNYLIQILHLTNSSMEMNDRQKTSEEHCSIFRYVRFIVYSQTRFRWVQTVAPSTQGNSPSWAIDDILIAERCPDMCRGRGDCIGGTCYCDPGYVGGYRVRCVEHVSEVMAHVTGGVKGVCMPSEGGSFGVSDWTVLTWNGVALSIRRKASVKVNLSSGIVLCGVKGLGQKKNIWTGHQLVISVGYTTHTPDMSLR